MSNKLATAHRCYFDENMVSYEKVLDMSEDDCVKVSRSYFYLLLAKYQILRIENDAACKIFQRYIDIEKKESYVYRSRSIFPYYLMTVNDIVFLMKNINDKPSMSNIFYKVDINKFEFEKICDELDKLYSEKQGYCLSKRKKA